MCSFGLRTIAVLMSLFPSLGISSFHTAVCCNGENEYTTHAPACQQDFAFFLDFFAFFLRKILLLARIAVAGTVMEGDFALQEGKVMGFLLLGGKPSFFFAQNVSLSGRACNLLQKIPGSSPGMTLLPSPR